jgi:PAS domain S-box-containing protein
MPPDFVSSARLAENLFDFVSDSIFFVKDLGGRYVSVNQSLVRRCGRRHKREIVGKTVTELYPANLAAQYAAQDRDVLRTGKTITHKLELHLYTNGQRGWCLTSKMPLRKDGKIVGLAGISHDIGAPDEERLIPPSLSATLEYLQEHYDRPLTIAKLASKAGLSASRFIRLVKKIFRLSPGQLLIQIRVQAATERLHGTDDSIAEIALACGFSDQSSFARRFKAVTGLTPLEYRRGYPKR